MARPNPPTVLKTTDDSGRVYEILASEKSYTLAYDGKPVAVRTTDYLVDTTLIRYPRTGFNNRAHAVRLAEKLNSRFKTQLFSVLEN